MGAEVRKVPPIVCLDDARDERIRSARRLFEEYARSLGVDLSFQGFDAELEHFPRGYLPPDGALLLALDGDAPAGVVAMRRLGADVCEMKRLYVVPAYRATGLGRALAQSIMARAREAGYASMRLDTLAQMSAARALYRSLEFVEIEPYYHNPIPGTVYLEATLE